MSERPAENRTGLDAVADMGSIYSYVRWRGDISLAERPFNIVDSLVLSALSYLDLDGVVPAPSTGAAVSVAEAARLVENAASTAATGPVGRLTIIDPSLLRDMGHSVRFRDAVLSDFVDVTDAATGVQFAAVTVHLDDGSSYVSFRGTDNTIVGWKEDFTMSFQQIPAQTHAADYLRRYLAAPSGRVRVGGHSKGGNLAVYAAMSAPADAQPRIVAVYNNDGPALSPQAIDPQKMELIADKVVKVVPPFAVVGMLFEPGAPTHIVASTATGLMQHDITTWQVERDALREEPALSSRAVAVNAMLDEWLADATTDERTALTEDLFGALGAGGASLITDVGQGTFGSFESVLFSLGRPRGASRSALSLWFRVLWRSVRAVDYQRLARRRDAIRTTLTAVLGLFFVVASAFAIEILGVGTLLVLIAAAMYRLGRHFVKFRRSNRPTWATVAIIVMLQIGISVVFTRVDALLVPTSIVLGLGLLANAWFSAWRGITNLRKGFRKKAGPILLITSGVISALFGIVSLSTVGQVTPAFIQQVGQYLLIVGLFELFLVVHRRVASQQAQTSLQILRGINSGPFSVGAATDDPTGRSA